MSKQTYFILQVKEDKKQASLKINGLSKTDAMQIGIQLGTRAGKCCDPELANKITGQSSGDILESLSFLNNFCISYVTSFVTYATPDIQKRTIDMLNTIINAPDEENKDPETENKNA